MKPTKKRLTLPLTVEVKGMGVYKHAHIVLEVIRETPKAIVTSGSFAHGIVACPTIRREQEKGHIFWDKETGRRLHPTYSNLESFYVLNLPKYKEEKDSLSGNQVSVA